MTTLDSLRSKPVYALTGLDRLDITYLGVDDFGASPYVETDDGERAYHTVGFTEYLSAVGREDLDQSELPKVAAAIRAILADKTSLSADTISTLDVSHLDSDEPGIAVEITFDSASNLTVEEAFNTIMWPFWAAMANMTDRGTFNWPYLWNQV